MWTILGAIASIARDKTDAPALSVLRDGHWDHKTYGTVQDEILRWASLFHRMDLKAGGVVFIILKHRADMYPAFLGAMRAGLVPSFLAYPTIKQNPTLYWAGYADLLARVRPECIVTYGDHVEHLKQYTDDFPCAILDIDAVVLPATSDPSLPSPDVLSGDDHVVLLQHSSGTTGLKKGVELNVRQIAAQFESYAQAVSLDESSRVVTWLPLYHDMGLISSFLLPLSQGAHVISIDAFDWLRRPDSLLTLIEEHNATHCWLPNFAFNHLIRTRNRKRHYNLASMVAFVSCSEPAKLETALRFAGAFQNDGLDPAALKVCYAMAETVFAVSQSGPGVTALTVNRRSLASTGAVERLEPAHPEGVALVSCGHVIPGIEIRIDTDQTGYVGEICVRGDFLFSGYHENIEATETALRDGWYHTGDMGFLYENQLYVWGRKKEILIIHGRNYYATDIEEIISTLDGVKPGRAVAFSLFDDRSGSEEAYILAESLSGDPQDQDALRERIQTAIFDRLELSVKKVEIVPDGSIIKTTSGKISRKDNKDRYEQDRLLASAEPTA